MYEFEENPIGDDVNINLEQHSDDDDLPEQPVKPAEDGVKVVPKKKIIRNPRVTLNTARLKGDRGLHTIEDYFRDMQFKGKGHEAEDLTRVMRKLEHWGHRVFPNMLFVDFVNRVEQLCRKTDVQSHMRKYKSGTLMPEVRLDDEMVDLGDEFDDLLSQQVQIQRNISNRDFSMDFSFNDEADVSLGVAEIPPTPPPTNLTDEAKARIAENRRAALERLRAKQAQVEVIPEVVDLVDDPVVNLVDNPVVNLVDDPVVDLVNDAVDVPDSPIQEIEDLTEL